MNAFGRYDIFLITLSLFFILSYRSAFADLEPKDETRKVRKNRTKYELRFGPEFTFWIDGLEFTTETIIDDEGNITKSDFPYYIIISRLKKHLIDNQPDGEKFMYYNDTFYSPHGWFFTVSTDPGVIEVTTSPMTVEQFNRFQSDMQDAIFVTHYNAGIYPALYGGGGHINIGYEYFKNKPLLFRNFVVDYLNHPELSLGVLNYDTNNAISFSLLPQQIISRFIDILDEELLSPHAKQNGADTYMLSSRIYNLLTSHQDPYRAYWSRVMGFEFNSARYKSYALNFLHLKNVYDTEDSHARIEIRAVRAQASMDVWVRQIRLFEKRIEYLKTLTTPLNYSPVVSAYPVPQFIEREHVETPHINPQEALKAFYQYVTESGEKWQDHRDYLWPQWLTPGGELDVFENSDWFKEKSELIPCNGLLAS